MTTEFESKGGVSEDAIESLIRRLPTCLYVAPALVIGPHGQRRLETPAETMARKAVICRRADKNFRAIVQRVMSEKRAEAGHTATDMR